MTDQQGCTLPIERLVLLEPTFGNNGSYPPRHSDPISL
jgi:hypothetical protein